MTVHLTVEQRQLARRLSAIGLSLREIGRQVGCSHEVVRTVVRRDSKTPVRSDSWQPGPGRLTLADREEIGLGLLLRGADQTGSAVAVTCVDGDPGEFDQHRDAVSGARQATGEGFSTIELTEAGPDSREFFGNVAVALADAAAVHGQPCHRAQVGIDGGEDGVLQIRDLCKGGGVTTGQVKHPIVPREIGGTVGGPFEIASIQQQPVIAAQQVLGGVAWPAAVAVGLRPVVQAVSVVGQPGRAERACSFLLDLFVAEHVDVMVDGPVGCQLAVPGNSGVEWNHRWEDRRPAWGADGHVGFKPDPVERHGPEGSGCTAIFVDQSTQHVDPFHRPGGDRFHQRQPAHLRKDEGIALARVTGTGERYSIGNKEDAPREEFEAAIEQCLTGLSTRSRAVVLGLVAHAAGCIAGAVVSDDRRRLRARGCGRCLRR
jgi:helix-turn-helix protein